MKENQNKSKFLIVIFIFLFVFLIEFYGFAWSRTQHRTTGYAIMALSADYENLIAQRKNLKIEVAVLKSPQRIERIAKNKMGLSTPGQNQILTIR